MEDRRLPPAYFNGDPVDAGGITVKPHKCPVCDGSGVVYGIAETGAMPTTKCHGCDGNRWVVA